MFKTEIEFSRNTLYVNLSGNISRENIRRLKQKIYYIIEEYNIYEIVINVKNSEFVDVDAFYNFLDEYDIKYGGNLIVVE